MKLSEKQAKGDGHGLPSLWIIEAGECFTMLQVMTVYAIQEYNRGGPVVLSDIERAKRALIAEVGHDPISYSKIKYKEGKP